MPQHSATQILSTSVNRLHMPQHSATQKLSTGINRSHVTEHSATQKLSTSVNRSHVSQQSATQKLSTGINRSHVTEHKTVNKCQPFARISPQRCTNPTRRVTRTTQFHRAKRNACGDSRHASSHPSGAWSLRWLQDFSKIRRPLSQQIRKTTGVPSRQDRRTPDCSWPRPNNTNRKLALPCLLVHKHDDARHS